ncbi:hypothetical protein K503DRAFT_766195 [Rhizopogon vinicolor AM-OR11-026]|uniref:Uncharacterized protein n=1 Tax=Rhizopogon vinicolor AM-OR11-026 TaxID=1314800 RepID=A0A1B7NDY9_9AGAM|nr:hypothetical protein K503DRAFT_766195 [Rhizopogon vinicolor AM-OR11-026]
MDPTFDVSNKVQDSTMVAKQRFESFKMGGGAPASNLTSYHPKHSHGRSRSRNSSISSLSTLSISASTSAPSFPTPPELFINTSTNAPSSVPPTKRPTSHHRRRSSVSTRCESAELMGVSLPDLPPAHSDDNINLGDRDSIRRRALWALEGKPDVAFSKVEIPDMTSPDLTKSFEFSTKPAFSAGTGISGLGINNLMSKRDSFGKLFGPTSTSKDQLHTLVEEEEEDEEQEQEEESQEECPGQAEVIEEVPAIELVTPASIAKSPARPRPASLNLKPLSLVSAVSCNPGNLPTPTLTPSHRHNGLRSLALASDANAMDSSSSSMIRHCITAAPSTGSFQLASRRSCSSETPSYGKRSSISYKRSNVSIPRHTNSLPSPDATPINCRFPELSDVGSISEEPLSASEQHFLFKSHNVLLSRIIDLERTLRSRSMSRSRPLSVVSDTSMTSSEPSDEMLQLISDLKAERDELKRDVDGWRMRVADADKQANVLARRVEAERMEAWVARSHLGLLEVEKNTLEKALGSKSSELEQSISQSERVKQECDGMREELDRLRARLRDADNAVDECIRLRAALDQERTRRAELEKLLDNAELLNTPTIPHPIDEQAEFSLPSRSFGTHPRGVGFQSVQSIDSDSSSTDVESVDHSFTKAELTLDAVTEEDEDFSDEDELAGYEDEDESDLSFQSPGGSSIGSNDEVDLGPVSVLNGATTRLNSLSKPVTSKPSHCPRASLSKTWTFPRGQTGAPVKHDADEIDRFFGCLDDIDNTSPLSEEMGKALFTSTFGSTNDDEDEDELPPFVIPLDVGTVVSELSTSKGLDVVLEEEEEGEADGEDDGEPLGEEVEGGIRFTFNPPAICTSPPPAICITPPTETEPALVHPFAGQPVPVYEFFDDEEGVPFTFPQSRVTQSSSSAPTSESSSRPSCRTINSPSSIPRATLLRSFVPSTPPCSATLPSDASGYFGAPPSYPATSFITPPSRRGGTTPSFIPQPVSPSPCKTATSTKSRVPILRSKTTTNVNDDATLRCFGTSEKIMVARSDSPDNCEYPERQASTSPFSSIMSSPLAARFSFQTFSNFIPLSWSPGAAAVSSHATPSISINSSDDDGAAEAVSLFASARPGVRRSAERRFVSRDQQLEKLRNRLGDDHNGIGHCLAVNACGSCKNANIFL